MNTKILYWYHNKLNNKSTPSFHRHPFYQLEIILKGSLHIGPAADMKKFKAPQIIVIPPNIEHTIGKREGEGEALSFKIKTEKTYDFPQKIFAVPPDYFTQWLTNSISSLIFENNAPLNSKIQIAEYIFGSFFEYLNKSLKNKTQTEPEIFALTREKVMAWGRMANIDNIAESIGFSPAHYKYIFRKTALENPELEIDTSPKNFIDNILVEMIERYLKYSKMPISQIAVSVKFPDIYKLSRFYFRMRGISPSDFRKSNIHRLRF